MKPSIHFEKYNVFKTPNDVDMTTLKAAYLLADLFSTFGMPVDRSRVVLYTVTADVADVPAAQFETDAKAAAQDISQLAYHFGIKTQPDDADGHRQGAIINCGQACQIFRLDPVNLLDAFVENAAPFYAAGTPKAVIAWNLISKEPSLLATINQRISNSIIPVVEADGGF